jgi:hypothetical protein
MRALILTAAVLGVLASANTTKAGLSTTLREGSAFVDTATVPEEATRENEDKIGLKKGGASRSATQVSQARVRNQDQRKV